MRSKEPTTASLIGGGELRDTGKDGQPVATQLGTGSVVAGQLFESPSDDELRVRTERVAGRFGLKIKSLTVFHPLESAIEVTFVLPEDATVDWTIDELRTALEGSPTTIEGDFIQIESSTGEPLLSTAAAYRMGGGGLWFAEGQDVRFGAVHGNPPLVGPDANSSQ